MAITKWQCTKCGTQVTQSNPPGQRTCPEGGYHVWSKLTRFLEKFFEM